MSRLWQSLGNNPVRLYAVLAGALAVAGAFGAGMTGPQQQALLGFAVAVLGGGEIVRTRVTPYTPPTPPGIISATVTSRIGELPPIT